MARLMSAAPSVDRVRDRSKTVTRRLGWLMLAPGDPLTLCEKVRGRKPGEPLVRIADVQVVSVRREPLNSITPEDVDSTRTRAPPAGSARSANHSRPPGRSRLAAKTRPGASQPPQGRKAVPIMPDSQASRPTPGLADRRDGNAPDQEQQVKKVKLVDFAEVRQPAHQDGDTQLANMNDRELRAAILENYCDQNATGTVIRTLAIDAQRGRGKGRRRNTDIAELGERVARALDEENTGTRAERIAVIVGRARTARRRAMRRSVLPPEMNGIDPSRGNQDAEPPRTFQGLEAHP